MPWFEYKALTPGGTMITGRIEAAERDEASKELKAMGVDVRELSRPTTPRPTAKGISADDLIFFNEQLASLAGEDIALEEGLAQLARDVESKRLKQWLDGLVADLRAGMTLDAAVAAREQGLPVLYSNVIRAGMATGNLAATLLDLNHHLRLMGDTRRILWEVASYPLVVAVLALGVMSMFFLYLIPQIGDIFLDFDVQLPHLTLLVIAVSKHFVAILVVIAFLVIAVTLGWQLLRRSNRGRAIRDRLLEAIPVLGKMYRASIIARFLRAVSAAVSSGVPLPASLRLGANAVGSDLLIQDAESLAAEVEAGESIFVASQSTRLIPPLFGFCVQTAAARDALPHAMDKLAQTYESRAVQTQTTVRTVLFPAMILFLGLILGVCVLAIFLPLVSLIGSMTG